jgi:hypothetical protein
MWHDHIKARRFRRGVRRLAALAAGGTVAAASLLTLAGTAHADDNLQLTGPSSPVPVNTSYTYTIFMPTAADSPTAYEVTATLTGVAATFTGWSILDNSVDSCVLSGTQATCNIDAANFPGSDVTIELTVLPTAAGTVDAAATALQNGTNFYGSDSTSTTIVASGPTVTSLSPTSGPLAGGTSVAITGTGFTGATAVTFGTTPATSFTVNSDTSITATAPAATSVGPVDVTVTTPGGTSTTSPADQYTYTYSFTGFFPPVNNPPALNRVNAGRTIPVKFSLGGNQGLAIFASGSPASQEYDCTTGAPIGASQPTTPGSAGLTYNSGSDQYTYHWSTDSAWAGTCRHLYVQLNDGTTHQANFQFH